MAEEIHWYDRMFAEGELGSEQLQRLNVMLENDTDVTQAPYRVVYLHHHPIHPKLFHQLKDSPQLEEALTGKRIDALLFGHNHAGYDFRGKWNIPRMYDAGTGTRKLNKSSRIRVMDLSRDPGFDYVLDVGGNI